MSLEGRHILLGITGSIAAYKAAILCRLLKGAGAEVKVVMTPLAKQFITPLTMATLSKHPILVEFFNPENGEWNSHVSLGEWADCLLIAPATANTLGKMAHGIADNLLLTTYLSARCPVAVAPAMDLDMFAHSATQENLRILRSRGVRIVEPAEGELASGLSGKGRMAEPTDIVARGIDIEDIGMVINYDVPHDPEDYIHRIGRTARASATGRAVTFVNEEEQGKFHRIEEFIEREIPKLSLPEAVGAGPEYNPAAFSGHGGRRGRSGSGRGGNGRSGGRGRSRGRDGAKSAGPVPAEGVVAAANVESRHGEGRGEGNRGSRDRGRRRNRNRNRNRNKGGDDTPQA